MGRGMLARQARSRGNRRQDLAAHSQSPNRPQGAPPGATYAKTGTTWTQQIVGKLVFRGAEFDAFAISPWVDFRLHPLDQVMGMLEAQNHRRFLKTHLPLDALVFAPVKRHNYKLCYTVTKLSLQAAGLVAKAKRRSAHRKKRLRRPLPGMLLFQDGSTHRWIATLGRDLDLILGSSPRTTLDDATGAIYSAFLVEQEGTMSSLLGLAETIGRHGLFSAFYTDRGGHYFITPKGAGKVDKTKLTQVGRALSQLGITHIPSYSPQARGRMERVSSAA